MKDLVKVGFVLFGLFYLFVLYTLASVENIHATIGDVMPLTLVCILLNLIYINIFIVYRD